MSEDKIVFEPLQAADEAMKVFQRQAEEATEAMSKNIPDLEGASL